MSTITPPQALALAADTSVVPPFGLYLGSCVLSNLSPYLLEVVINADSYWLNPWEEQIYPIAGNLGVPIRVTPRLLIATTLPVGAGAQVQATWYSQGENPDGNWPISLAANAIAGTINAVTQFIDVPLTGTAGVTIAPSAASAPIDVTGYASVIVTNDGTTAPFFITYTFSDPAIPSAVSGFGNGDFGNAASTLGSTSLQPYQIPVTGTQLVLINDSPGPVTLFVTGTNRIIGRTMSLIDTSEVATYSVTGAPFVAGVNYDMGLLQSTPSGRPIQCAFTVSTAAPKGFFNIIGDNGLSITVADTTEMHVTGAVQSIYKQILLPTALCDVVFACRGTGGAGVAALATMG